jgi:TolA-binding protein
MAPARRAAAFAALAALLALAPSVPRAAAAPTPGAAPGAAATPAAEPKGFVSCRDPGRRSSGAAARPGEPRAPRAVNAEWDAFAKAIDRYAEEAVAFREEAQALIKKEFEAKRGFLSENYEQAVIGLEVLERNEREDAIAKFDEFVARYPDDPTFAADAIFRLAELQYEKANDDFAAQLEAYKEEAKRASAEGRDLPPEPTKSYAPSISLYQRLITRFPNYRFAHGVYYLLAYCLAEMGQGDESRVAYQTLIQRFPESPFVPEAWVRLGDWYFDAVEADSLQNAAASFSRIYAYPEHPLYARAIYKLGWTYYRMDSFEEAVRAFVYLLDYYVEKSKATGSKVGGDVWPEAIQYTAISFADETWGGLARAKAFFAQNGHRPYEAEVFARIGDVYFEETKYLQAVDAYRYVLAVDPFAPEAPRVHAKIVQAWNKDRRFDLEAAERENFVAAYEEGGVWWERNKSDPDLLAQVRDVSEKSLIRAASFRHAQAQKYKEEGNLEIAVSEYRGAARAYGDYLRRYPHSRDAYELSYKLADCLYNGLEFEQAARVYARVRDFPDERYRAEAAVSAVISWEGEITRLQRLGKLEDRKVLLSTDRPSGAAPAVERVPAAWASLVRDSDAYLELLPRHEKAPAVAYKAAEVFYKYGDFDEARCRFEKVVAQHPSTEVAKFAANLIIESFLTQKDWAAVEETSARLQSSEVAKNKELHTTLQKFKLGGRFNRAMQAMDAKKWEDGARLFLALVAEEPKHEFADKALYNAASCYESGRRFESALKLYERISVEYPASVLADEALFRVAYNAENTYDFDKAVDRYLALVEKYQKSKHRKDALYNAARSLENLQRYEKAAAAFARYALLYPDAEDAARTQFHAALIYEKTQDWKREIQALQEFAKRFSKTKETDLLVQANLKIAHAWHELKDEKKAREGYAATLAEFAAKGLRPEASPRAAAAAAEARFQLAEIDFDKYDKITLPATTDTKKLKKALDAKFAEAKKVAPIYDDVMKYKRPDWTLAAFYRKAYLLERLAQTIYDAPPPPEFKAKGAEEYLAAYQDGLAQFAQPFEDQAVSVYIQAIEAARKLHVKNEWTKRIGESLARFRPREYPVLKEPRARMLADDRAPVYGADTPAGPSVRKEEPPPEAAPAAATTAPAAAPGAAAAPAEGAPAAAAPAAAPAPAPSTAAAAPAAPPPAATAAEPEKAPAAAAKPAPPAKKAPRKAAATPKGAKAPSPAP